MSREQSIKVHEINLLVKGFPLKVEPGVLARQHGTISIGELFSYKKIEFWETGTVMLLEKDTQFFDILYGVLRDGMLYEVDIVDGDYRVVNVIEARKWFDEKVNVLMEEWEVYMNGGKDNE